MRQIKFRAWNKEEKQMVDLYKITPLALESGMSTILSLKGGSGLFLPFLDEILLMQYTGLKGIYEDDIISDNVGIGRIEYVEKYAAFRVNYFGTTQAKWFYDYLDSESKTIEIIGNIHENPELLTKDK